MKQLQLFLLTLLLLTGVSSFAQDHNSQDILTANQSEQQDSTSSTEITSPTKNVDFHLYLTDENEKLKVRINYPTSGKLKLTLTDAAGEIYYESKIDLYQESVINIIITYLSAGKYFVNLEGEDFIEQKPFTLP